MKSFNLSMNQEEKLIELRQFNKQMKSDGHTEQFRIDITNAVMKKVKKEEDEDIEGKRSYYRSREERLKENKEKKKTDKTAWFREKGYDGILKVEYTPQGTLASRIKSRLKKEVPGAKFLIQETAGRTLKSLVSNSKDPWKNPICGRSKCYPCLTSQADDGLNGKCWQNNSTYRVECLLCRQKEVLGVYVGESRNLFQRSKQHADALRKKSETSVLFRHMCEDHPEVAENDVNKTDFKNFEFKPGREAKSPLERQATEGAELVKLIKESKEKNKLGQSQHIIFNSKSEFNQPAGLLKVKTTKFWD